MDLSLVTVEQMLDELEKRGLEFSVILSRDQPGESHPEQPEYELYSSFDNSLHQSVHFLLGSVSILGTVMEELEERSDGRADVVRQWVETGETLLSDLMRSARDWNNPGSAD